MENTAEWQALTAADLAVLCGIAGRVHPALPERAEVFAEKLRLFPAGCLKWVSGGRMAGYGLAHPWALNSAPGLDAFMYALPGNAGCLYIHDVALLPEARGQGAARAFVLYAERLARGRGLGALALVSVYGTGPLWESCGFRPAGTAATGLASYGPGAEYMVRSQG